MRHNIIPREFPTWQKLGFKSWTEWQEAVAFFESLKEYAPNSNIDNIELVKVYLDTLEARDEA